MRLFFRRMLIYSLLPRQALSSAPLSEIQLMNNAFSGVLPDTWASLTRLQILAVQGNQLTGPLPVSWSQLTVSRGTCLPKSCP